MIVVVMQLALVLAIALFCNTVTGADLWGASNTGKLTRQKPFEACTVSSSSVGPGENHASFSARLPSLLLEPC